MSLSSKESILQQESLAMNIPELVTDLMQQGVRFQIKEDKLRISSVQAILTDDLLVKLGNHKPEILTFLRQRFDENLADNSSTQNLENGSSLDTIGRLISGSVDLERSGEYRSPTVDTGTMAKKLAVVFKPVGHKKETEKLQQFSDELKDELKNLGVKVIPWQEASNEYSYELKFPIVGFKKTLKRRLIKSSINAVIDIEKAPSILTRIKIYLAEIFYFLYAYLFAKDKKISVSGIAMLTGWAENHIALQLENPSNTQVIMLTQFNPEFANPQLNYQQKIKIGLNTLVRTFSEIVIGVSDTRLSILNMNLSDSVFPRSQVGDFILNSLIPKVFVPILPLSISRFECGQYEPQASPYAKNLVELSQALAATDLFPSGSKLSQVIKRRSHRDLVDVIVNGRTGVSYGFLAYAEPPQYFGSSEITEAEWSCLQPVPGFSSHEVRRNERDRWYIKTSQDNGSYRFQQIPDIWIVSSRSGSSKTNLNLERDVVRMGLKKGLFFQIPQGTDPERMDIKPSYDIYVMLAIALSAALYTPKLIEKGLPIVHFHGYPSSKWFQPNEYCAGVKNPSVPCGTYESGVLNYLGLHRVGKQHCEPINLVSLIEPDHGTNIIAKSSDYLIHRLKTGCKTGEIKLGGEHFTSLKEISI
jgi:TubC N-terminal docking domain